MKHKFISGIFDAISFSEEKPRRSLGYLIQGKAENRLRKALNVKSRKSIQIFFKEKLKRRSRSKREEKFE